MAARAHSVLAATPVVLRGDNAYLNGGGTTAAQLRAYIDGVDPITGRPVMQEVVQGLTRPISDVALA